MTPTAGLRPGKRRWTLTPPRAALAPAPANINAAVARAVEAALVRRQLPNRAYVNAAVARALQAALAANKPSNAKPPNAKPPNAPKKRHPWLQRVNRSIAAARAALAAMRRRPNNRPSTALAAMRRRPNNRPSTAQQYYHAPPRPNNNRPVPAQLPIEYYMPPGPGNNRYPAVYPNNRRNNRRNNRPQLAPFSQRFGAAVRML